VVRRCVRAPTVVSASRLRVKYDDGSHRYDLLDSKRKFSVVSLHLHARNCRLLVWNKVRCHVSDATRMTLQSVSNFSVMYPMPRAWSCRLSHLIYLPQLAVNCVLHLLHTSVYARSAPNKIIWNIFLNILHSTYKTTMTCVFSKCLICDGTLF